MQEGQIWQIKNRGNKMDAITKFEQEQIQVLSNGKEIPDFKAGDSVNVGVRIVEGSTERVQAYEGVVIARRNAGVNSSFTVRKISHGEGVERKFKIYSPMIASIKVVKRGIVKRAKLYYLRDRRGKSARIREKLDFQTKASKAVQNVAPKTAPKKEASAAE